MAGPAMAAETTVMGTIVPQPVVLMSLAAGDARNPHNSAFHCALCVKSFGSYNSLRRHQGVKHGKRTVFSCTFCMKTFSTRGNLSRHKTVYHFKEKFKREGTTCTIKCGVCTALFRTTEALCVHLRKIHCFDINVQKLHFTSREQFVEWRKQVESEGSFEFVNRSGKNSKREYFRCHRSGLFITKARGIRSPRARGTRRIDFHCSAFATVKYLDEEQVEVVTCIDHYGHDAMKNQLDDDSLNKQSPKSRFAQAQEQAQLAGYRKALRLLESRHELSRNLFRQQFIRFENGWQVTSEDVPGESYFVRKNRELCECKLRCPTCHVCSHIYTCSCPDALKTHIVCKHQHYIHTHFDLEHRQHQQHLMNATAMGIDEGLEDEEEIVDQYDDSTEENPATSSVVTAEAVVVSQRHLTSGHHHQNPDVIIEETPDISLPIMEIDVFTSGEDDQGEKRMEILNRWSSLMDRLPYCSDVQLHQLYGITEKLEEIVVPTSPTWYQQQQDASTMYLTNDGNDKSTSSQQHQQNSYHHHQHEQRANSHAGEEYARKRFT